MRGSRRSTTCAALLVALLASAGYAYAQRGLGDLGFFEPVRFAPSQMPDRKFTICRIMYTSVRR